MCKTCKVYTLPPIIEKHNLYRLPNYSTLSVVIMQYVFIGNFFYPLYDCKPHKVAYKVQFYCT